MLHLFGDESCFDTAVVYAVVIAPFERQQEIEDAFGYVKECFGVPRTTRIHCRALFAGDQRRKGSWAHLSKSDLFELMSMTGNYLRSSGCRFRVGLIDTRQTGERFSAWRSFRAYPAGLKQLVVWAHACAVGGLDRYPGGEELKLWKDPDDTSIEWGNGRRKAAALPVHLERGRQLKSEAIVGEKPHLIDVADMLAYSTSHAFCEVERPDRPSFGRAFDAFLPDMAKMHWHPHAFDGAQEDQQAVDDWLRRGRDLQLPLATLTK